MKCEGCIHKPVCGRQIKYPCGEYKGHCEDCAYWTRDKNFSSGECCYHVKTTYQHYFCGAYTDPEWVQRYKPAKGGEE